MKRIIAIDPGANGAIAVLTHGEPDTITTFTFGTNDINDLLYSQVSLAGSVTAVIEQVGPIFTPGGKVSPKAMFSFGQNFGYLQGWLRGAGVPYRTVLPKVWQKDLNGLSGHGMDRKRALKAIAARMYPDLKVTLGNCDALLILDWARRNGV